MLLFSPSGHRARAQPTETSAATSASILIVFGPHYGIPTAEIFVPVITDSLEVGGVPGESIYVEFLDLYRFPDLAGSSGLSDLFSLKYSDTQIDLVIPISQEAVDFVARDLSFLFSEAPMLIPGFEAEPAWAGPRRPLIVLPTELDLDGTLRLAADLFPAAERLLVVTGDDEHSRLFLEMISSAADRFPQFSEVRHTADMAYPQMLEMIAKQPRNTVAVFGTYFVDAAGETFTPAAVAAEAAARSSVPVFGIRDVHVESGLVGGSVIVTAILGEQVAGVALDYLVGKLELSGGDVTLEAQHFPLFDWQQLVRYGVDPRTLPDTTVFLNKPETLWDTHRSTVITAAAAVVILALLSVFLVIQNGRLQTSLRSQQLTEERITAALNDKDTLIRELYHRTNNNLQVVEGLLRYRQSAHAELPLAQFVDSVVGQVRLMAQAQQELFRAKHLSRIDLAGYLRSLVGLVRDRHPDQWSTVTVAFHLQPVSILLDSAVPLGLAVNELVTNAFRHACPDARGGEVSGEIALSCAASESGEIEIRVSDNGVQSNPNSRSAPSDGGDLELVAILVEQQLGGTVVIQDITGTTGIVRFRDDRYGERV